MQAASIDEGYAHYLWLLQNPGKLEGAISSSQAQNGADVNAGIGPGGPIPQRLAGGRASSGNSAVSSQRQQQHFNAGVVPAAQTRHRCAAAVGSAEAPVVVEGWGPKAAFGVYETPVSTGSGDGCTYRSTWPYPEIGSRSCDLSSPNNSGAGGKIRARTFPSYLLASTATMATTVMQQQQPTAATTMHAAMMQHQQPHPHPVHLHHYHRQLMAGDFEGTGAAADSAAASSLLLHGFRSSMVAGAPPLTSATTAIREQQQQSGGKANVDLCSVGHTTRTAQQVAAFAPRMFAATAGGPVATSASKNSGSDSGDTRSSGCGDATGMGLGRIQQYARMVLHHGHGVDEPHGGGRIPSTTVGAAAGVAPTSGVGGVAPDGANNSLTTKLATNATTAPTAAPTTTEKFDDEDRMVYVSWIPKRARAFTLEKRAQEIELRRRLRSIFTQRGLFGLKKVLLFPPKGLHCKLIFETRDAAVKYLQVFGGDFGSATTEMWKRDVCQAYQIKAKDSLSGTKVKIGWAEKHERWLSPFEY
eukprot:GHVU01170870.1.p1 GENE.GHVU01170870.1~~GHVU01170870.1.p1  ORF type:complete len:529 (-),score=69.34 GHVU01170870.1:4515-6101(-)